MKKHLFNFILVLFLAFGVSCATNRPFIESGLITEKQVSITKKEIFVVLIENGIFSNESQFPDTKYVLPTKEWVKNEFSYAFGRFLNEFNGIYWKHENWDCDDYSKAANFFASVLHYKSQLNNSGFAFGEVFYIKDNRDIHAANIFIYKDKDKNKLLFYEPQARMIYDLSKEEKMRVFYVRF